MLEESTGLVYFGARWYDPEVGRFISVDPAEDGENWYALCDNDPVNYFDPDGRLSLRGWGVLWGGLKLGFKQYALKTVGNVATGIAIGSAIAVCMPAIMPTLPASIPIIVAAASYTMIACDIGPDLVFLVKEFSTVFLSKNPSDAKVRAYGFTISKVGLKFAGLLATSYGMRAIMKTGILQKAGVWLKNTSERGSVNLNGNNNPVLNKPRVGSALKNDTVKPIRDVKGKITKEFPATAKSHGFPDVVDNYAGNSKSFDLGDGATLYQLLGSMFLPEINPI